MVNKFIIIFILLTIVSFADKEFPHEDSIQIIDGEEYVPTPFGLMLRECVSNLPSGTHVKEKEDGLDFSHSH